MKLWRTARGKWAERLGWNNLVVETLIGLRNDNNQVKDYSTFAARPLAELAVKTFTGCVTVEVAKAVAPVVVTIEKMDSLYASLNYTAPVRPFDMRAAEQRAFPTRRYL